MDQLPQHQALIENMNSDCEKVGRNDETPFLKADKTWSKC